MASTSPSSPRRRFLPQPVETSTRSSKRMNLGSPGQSSLSTQTASADEPMASHTKPRRFLPQPIEETTRSSRRSKAAKEEDTGVAAEKPSASSYNHSQSPDDSTCPGHPTTKSTPPSTRRFAPEPVEQSSRTSRRKFAVEPVETSTRSSKDKSSKEQDSSSNRPRRKFAPQPVETSTRRRRKTSDEDEDSNDSPSESTSESSSRASSRQSTGNRRFAPDLIETAKGSYRHRKDSEQSHSSLSPRPASPASFLSSTPPDADEACESRFSAAALAKKNHEQHRRHSYCVPNLPMIESDDSEDEESDTPSLTESPSSTDNERSALPKIEEKESYTDYVFGLLNDKDRRRLQEQAMAAYINERPHEPVNHFAVEDDDDDMLHVGTLSGSNGADPKTFRRSSESEHDWEMENMRKHHEQLEKAKQELQEDTAGASRFSAAALACRHHQNQLHKQQPKTQKQKNEESEFARMRQAASPPMLGDDLVFPYTITPKMTRCDVDQAPRPRRADSDDDMLSVGSPTQPLWSASVGICNNQNNGLWMGLCQKREDTSSRPMTPIRSGLQTPAYELSNPFDSQTPNRGTRTPSRKNARPHSGLFMMPLTPARSAESQNEFVDEVDKKLKLERQIEEEFPNRVVTQIYNYLSLGYPSLARAFDDELSKISRIPVSELRKDDHIQQGTIKGYVGVPEGEGVWEEDEEGVVKGCRRWEALKLYVKEWARQSPNFTLDQSLPAVQDPNLAHVKAVRAEAWGATVRKGSWAQ